MGTRHEGLREARFAPKVRSTNFKLPAVIPQIAEPVAVVAAAAVAAVAAAAAADLGSGRLRPADVPKTATPPAPCSCQQTHRRCRSSRPVYV